MKVDAVSTIDTVNKVGDDGGLLSRIMNLTHSSILPRIFDSVVEDNVGAVVIEPSEHSV